jgi:hypothetical protein
MTIDYAADRYAAGNMPAFPCEAQGDRSVPPAHDYLQTGIHSAKFPGMTLRDYIATAALTGMLSGRSATALDGTPHEYALDAYHYADAMLAARQEPTS